MRGNITKRGKTSYRIKFELPPSKDGTRNYHVETVRGSRQDAERELAKQISAVHGGTYVEQAKTTVGEYLVNWLDGLHGLAGKTVERYRQLAQQQINPHLGHIVLQKLRPVEVKTWHAKLLKEGGKDGGPLSAQTVQHAHRCLHTALQAAVLTEMVARNVASVVRSPKVEQDEVEILGHDQIAAVIKALDGHPLKAIAVVALGSGARRGELLALTWGNINLDKATMQITRSLEQTKAGLKFKSPKNSYSRRTITLPATAVEALRVHRKQQLETRLKMGQGRPDADTLVFSRADGSAYPPNDLSRDWVRVINARKLPAVSFHGLRHTHASGLISKRVDVLTVSRRLGHADAVVTMKRYAHLFVQNDSTAADAIEAALRSKEKAQ
jgi:integrase